MKNSKKKKDKIFYFIVKMLLIIDVFYYIECKILLRMSISFNTFSPFNFNL